MNELLPPWTCRRALANAESHALLADLKSACGLDVDRLDSDPQTLGTLFVEASHSPSSFLTRRTCWGAKKRSSGIDSAHSGRPTDPEFIAQQPQRSLVVASHLQDRRAIKPDVELLAWNATASQSFTECFFSVFRCVAARAKLKQLVSRQKLRVMAEPRATHAHIQRTVTLRFQRPRQRFPTNSRRIFR